MPRLSLWKWIGDIILDMKISDFEQVGSKNFADVQLSSTF